jgi:Skp family chaperone for outer membrane proteins
MYDVEVLTSDEFATFSGSVSAVASRKKAKQQELRELVAKGQAELKAMDEEVAALNAGFEEWNTKRTAAKEAAVQSKKKG